CMQGLQLPSF
nr:immunoglobulin light chain junction region [Macaca mulatta]